MISTGKILAILLVSGLLLFGIVDWLMWIIGYETMSQWVIKKSTISKGNKALAALFSLIVTGVGVWLFFHFELIG